METNLIVFTGWREDQIKRIQMEFGYSYSDAAKVYELQQFKATQIAFNSSIGLFAAYKFGPMQKEASMSYPLFRKAWMRFPI